MGSPAVDKFVSGVSDLGSSASDFVSHTVESVGKGIENTVNYALQNPVATILDVAAVATGNAALVPYINAGNAVAKGASPEDVAKSFATSYVASQLAPDVGTSVAESTGSSTLGSAAQGAAQGATSAALTGKDIVAGATQGGLNAGVNAGVNSLANTAATAINTPSLNKDSLNYTVPPELLPPEESGGLSTLDQSNWDVQPTDYSLLSNKTQMPGVDPTTGTGLTAPIDTSNDYSLAGSIGGLGLHTPESPAIKSMGGGQGLTIPMTDPVTGQTGVLGSLGFTPTGAQPVIGDPSSFINNPDVTGQPILATDPAYYDVTLPRIPTSLNQSSKSATEQRQRALGYAFGADCMGVPWLDTRAQMLRPIEINEVESPTGYAGGLSGASTKSVAPISSFISQDLPGIEPELMDVIKERGYYTPLAEGGTVQNFADGSSAMSYCSASKFMDQFTPKFYSVRCNMLQGSAAKRAGLTLAQLQQLRPSIAGGYNTMAKGGLPTKYKEAAPDGHHPEFITGLTGYYAGGRGTGQSDDIPAMLHDGDYVIDAEAVSALGDGSSKAGNEVLMNFMHQIPHPKTDGGKPVPAKIADGEVVLPASFVTALGGGDNKHGAKMLDEMRKRLREHKRSAPDTKIPPKAKSPLEYLRGVKG